MSNRYNNTKLVWVEPLPSTTIKYGFRTKIDAAALGHNDITGQAYPAYFVIGANSPKPPRFKKTKASGTVSSFGSAKADKVAAARAAGWQLLRGPQIKVPRDAKFTFAVFVKLEGDKNARIKYAWNIPKDVFNKIGAANAKALGILKAEKGDLDLAWGVNYPKPIRGYATVGTNVVSTYIDADTIPKLPEGWGVVSTGSTETLTI